jgi:hypothetical protein
MVDYDRFSNIEPLLVNYFEEMTFLEDSVFSDGIHLKNPKEIVL